MLKVFLNSVCLKYLFLSVKEYCQKSFFISDLYQLSLKNFHVTDLSLFVILLFQFNLKTKYASEACLFNYAYWHKFGCRFSHSFGVYNVLARRTQLNSGADYM